MRAGSTFRESLIKERNAVHNQMIRWLDRYFPEFVQVFPSFGKMALVVLEKTPFPMDIASQTIEGLMERYRQSEALKCPQKPKVQKLLEMARHSIGITEGQQMARIEIATLVRRYRQLEQEIAALTEELTALAQTTVEYEWLQTIPGLGEATIIELLSEIGSFHQYQDPRQLIKLAGLTLKEHSSGQHKGQKRISKRGRRRLRALLFRVMIPLIRHNKAFRTLHEYYTTRPVNPLRKKQSIVVLCGKLLKILYAVCVKQQAFDEERMMQDIFSSTQAQAA
ncbi:transposase IS116/IS110/IS902 family protein [Anoxybacillus amylolyticus]|uniref:Transposase IS116/IS110/IS902 family protein n=1 Tax=Anoxybacteroides amylolyticum TaxID=294699 RepID=A0A167SZ18_9BACL|nr:transposase IS116/IS110/IS902 family protein [Anoxybacillus amylolyticus]